jgi:hypothetical protein
MRRIGTTFSLVAVFAAGWLTNTLTKQPTFAQDNQTKTPRWSEAYDLAVRKFGETTFNKDTKRVSVEVYRDVQNGTLIYLTETGNIAVVKLP